MTPNRFLLAAALAVAVSAPALADPQITLVSPTYFKAGTLVVVTGRGFALDNTVYVGATAIRHIHPGGGVGVMPLAPIQCRNGTKCVGGIRQYLKFKVPKGVKPGRQLLTVETFEGRSSGLWVSVLAK